MWGLTFFLEGPESTLVKLGRVTAGKLDLQAREGIFRGNLNAQHQENMHSWFNSPQDLYRGPLRRRRSIERRPSRQCLHIDIGTGQRCHFLIGITRFAV